jgi:hypothetical protein
MLPYRNFNIKIRNIFKNFIGGYDAGIFPGYFSEGVFQQFGRQLSDKSVDFCGFDSNSNNTSKGCGKETKKACAKHGINLR